MTTAELLKKIRRIEIQTKSLTKQFFSGQYHSSFKGRGMTFSEVREYQIGDEVRTIDWNVTARFNDTYVKVFEEERELLVMLVVDISGSIDFGTQQQTKKELALEVMAILAFSAVENNDKVGALFIADGVEKFIAPGKGRKHALYILREFIEFTPKSRETHLAKGLEFFVNSMKRRSTCFIISDFLDNHPFNQSLLVVNKKHDLVALQITDYAEDHLPDIGIVQWINAESNTYEWVNTSDKNTRALFERKRKEQKEKINDTFKKSGIAHAVLQTGQDFVPTMIQLFKRHAK